MQSYEDEFLDEIFETTKPKKQIIRNDAIFDSMDFLNDDEIQNDKIANKTVKKFSSKDDKFFDIKSQNSQIQKTKKPFFSFFHKKDKDQNLNLQISENNQNENLQNDIKLDDFTIKNTNLQKEKDEILQNYDNEIYKERNFTILHLLYVYVAMGTFLLSTLPFLYIKNEIYYISRDISALRNKHEVLLEENRNLKTNIELIRYKHEIKDNFDISIE